MKVSFIILSSTMLDEVVDEDEGEKVSSASIRSLPSSELEGLWRK